FQDILEPVKQDLPLLETNQVEDVKAVSSHIQFSIVPDHQIFRIVRLAFRAAVGDGFPGFFLGNVYAVRTPQAARICANEMPWCGNLGMFRKSCHRDIMKGKPRQRQGETAAKRSVATTI
ncbi:MAG: hypothetical protein R3236_04100, partial [Phycisphaeraceae bacterium]|nr:hypothetical protein [Phycisphaeraceae bacterium]